MKIKPLLADLVVLLPLFSNWETSAFSPLSALSSELFALILRPALLADLVVFLPLFSNWVTSESSMSLVSSLSSKLYALMMYTYKCKLWSLVKIFITQTFRQNLSRDVHNLKGEESFQSFL